MSRYLLLSVFVCATLSGCGLFGNRSLGENAYHLAEATPPLQVPEHLKSTTNLTPIYKVSEGKRISPSEHTPSIVPPNLLVDKKK